MAESKEELKCLLMNVQEEMKKPLEETIRVNL